MSFIFIETTNFFVIKSVQNYSFRGFGPQKLKNGFKRIMKVLTATVVITQAVV